MKAYSELPNIEVVGLTSPWYPDRDSMSEATEMDGITYHRCLHPARMKSVSGTGMKWAASRGEYRIAGSAGFASKPLWKRVFSLAFKPLRPGWAWVEERILFKHFTKRIIEVAKSESADIIHAHVPYRVGIPAMRAARELGLPFVYEMRGMWEESAVASGRWKAGGLAHRRFRRMETKVLREADSVICISETLRQEAISRGVSEDKISVVPNAVDIETQREESELFNSMKEKLQDRPVVGYIGSLRELEGVDLTAKAVSILKEQGVDVNFFVLSSESGQDELRDYCQSLGIAEQSHIVGPVPHEQVAPFYDLIDVFVVSRPDTRVTRLVTPLKPFEAMRSGRAVVMSDLPALAEIIEDGKTGILYPAGDAQALSEVINQLLQDESKRVKLGEAAKSWIFENRTWNTVVLLNSILQKRPDKIRLLTIGSVDESHGGRTTGGVARLHSLQNQTWVNNPILGVEIVGTIATNTDLNTDPITGVTYFSRRSGESQLNALSRIIDESNPDCILLHHIATGWGSAIQKIPKPPKIVGFIHSWRVTWEKYDSNYPKKLDIAKSAIKHIESLLYLSHHCATEMEELDIHPDSAIHVLPPPVFVPNFDIEKISRKREEKHIVFLGNLLEHKNILQLLEAIKHLTEYKLTVIGSGKLDDEVSHYVAENDLQNRIKTTGYLSDSQISEIFLTGDIFCAPSMYEPFGLVYIEALAHGLPVIGYGPSINEIEDYMGIKCGYALSSYDSDSIKYAILELSNVEWDRSQLHNSTKSMYSPLHSSLKFAESIFYEG